MAGDYILMAGGAGYVGSHVNKYLHQLGYQTVVIDNLCRGHEEFVRWGEFVRGDLANKDDIRACFRKYPITGVMHFGAFAYVGESVETPAEYYENNVCNTLNLLNVMREFQVNRFIFSSTCSTYGVPLETPITEAHTQQPINPYGRSKLFVEQIARDFERAYGLKFVSLRYFNAAGADPDAEIGEKHDPETHLIPIVLDVALGGINEVRVFGTDYDTPDGTCIRDYIHVMDLAQAHASALHYLGDGGLSDAFNLGNGNGFSVRQVIETATEITGRKIRWVPSDRRPGDPPILIGSSEKARKVLHWAPQYADLRVIVGTAWKWQQKMRSASDRREQRSR